MRQVVFGIGLVCLVACLGCATASRNVPYAKSLDGGRFELRFLPNGQTQKVSYANAKVKGDGWTSADIQAIVNTIGTLDLEGQRMDEIDVVWSERHVVAARVLITRELPTVRRHRRYYVYLIKSYDGEWSVRSALSTQR